MSFLKKKLNALLPGESTRGALQNILTVEWDDNKTVLVHVPASGSARSNEVELAEYGASAKRDHGSYGRLGDDDDARTSLRRSGRDDDDDYFPRDDSDFEQPRLPPRRPSTKSHSYSYNPTSTSTTSPSTSTSSTKALPPLPDRRHTSNPFETTSFNTSAYAFDRSGDYLDEQRGGAERSKAGNPWSVGEVWERQVEQRDREGRLTQTSPTSSTGTWTSTGEGEVLEDPFR